MFFESDTKIDLENHIKEKHTESFKCEFCDFVRKTEGGHKRKMNQLNWNLCEVCNFKSKTESEMQTHISEFQITYSRRNYNEHIHQVNSEISNMSKKVFILKTFQTAEQQNHYLKQNYSKSIDYNENDNCIRI